MITQTSTCFISTVLLAFGLFTLTACEENPAAQQPVTRLAAEETAPAQITTAQEEQETFPEERTVFIHQLPPEARQTMTLIYQRGPFPYPRDGITFANREQLLPLKDKDYYREYTVPTPGAKDRGARRIVCGGEKPSLPERCYYSADHYQSFYFILDATVDPDDPAEP